MLPALPPRKTFAWLGALVLTLGAAGVSVQYARQVLGHGRLFGAVRLFNMNGEGNFPSWVSSTLMLLCALLLWELAGTVGTTLGPANAKRWKILAAIFLYMSADEASAIHEEAIGLMRLGLPERGAAHFLWVLPVLALLAAFGAAFWRFWLALPGPSRRHFAVSAAVYLSGALGADVWSEVFEVQGRSDTFAYGVCTSVEETLELAGLSLFLFSLLDLRERAVALARDRSERRQAA